MKDKMISTGETEKVLAYKCEQCSTFFSIRSKVSKCPVCGGVLIPQKEVIERVIQK